MQQQDQLLGAAYRERRNDDASAPRTSALHHVFQLVNYVRGALVKLAAVSAFENQILDRRKRIRRARDGQIGAAHIA